MPKLSSLNYFLAKNVNLVDQVGKYEVNYLQY